MSDPIMRYVGLPITASSFPPDGQVYILSGPLMPGDGKVVIGVKHESDIAHEARSIVRQGLRAELLWLEEPVLTGREVLDVLRSFNDQTSWAPKI